MFTLEGSGLTPTEAIEGSGAATEFSVEGSGTEGTTEEMPTPEDRPERSTTVTSEEVTSTEPPQNLDLVFPKPTSCCEENTPIPPTDTTASLLLAVLKGEVWKQNPPKVQVEIEKVDVVSVNDTKTTTETESTEAINGADTTTDSSSPEDIQDKTEQLPIIEYIDLILPSAEEASSEGKEGNRVLIPLENIKWNFSSESLDGRNRTEPPKNASESSFHNVPFFDGFKVDSVVIDGLKPERTRVDDVNGEPTERTVQDGVVINKVASETTQDSHESKVVAEQTSQDQNKVAADAWWVETSPFGTSWVRFPDQQAPSPHGQRRGPLDDLQTSQKEEPGSIPGQRISSKFRFPEEAVAPEHRSTILKFWSRIPMFQAQEQAQKDYQSDEQHWFAP